MIDHQLQIQGRTESDKRKTKPVRWRAGAGFSAAFSVARAKLLDRAVGAWLCLVWLERDGPSRPLLKLLIIYGGTLLGDSRMHRLLISELVGYEVSFINIRFAASGNSGVFELPYIILIKTQRHPAKVTLWQVKRCRCGSFLIVVESARRWASQYQDR